MKKKKYRWIRTKKNVTTIIQKFTSKLKQRTHFKHDLITRIPVYQFHLERSSSKKLVCSCVSITYKMIWRQRRSGFCSALFVIHFDGLCNRIFVLYVLFGRHAKLTHSPKNAYTKKKLKRKKNILYFLFFTSFDPEFCRGAVMKRPC